MYHYPIFFAQIQTGEVSGNFDLLQGYSAEVFWTALPIGFAFAMIVWIGSATISSVYKLVRAG
jgi:hypothetical protein